MTEPKPKRRKRPAHWAPEWKPPSAHVEERDETAVEAEIGQYGREMVGQRDAWIEDGGLLVRTMDMAALAFGVTRRTVCDRIARGCPGKLGRYDLPDMIRGSRRNVRVRGGGLE